MNPLQSGKFRQRVQLQAPNQTEVFDSFGQPVVTWTTLGTYWAQVSPLTGHELVSARQVKAQASLKVRIRYQGQVSVSPENRLVLNGRTLGLIDVRNIEERNRVYEMTAYEIQQAGPV